MINDSVGYAVGRAQGQPYNIFKTIDGGYLGILSIVILPSIFF